MAGFRSQTGLSPLPAKDLTTAGLQTETRAKRFPKLKARKQVRESVKPLIIQDTPQQSIKEKSQVKETTHETSTTEVVPRRRTRSQMAKEKGKLVAVEESPVSKENLNYLS